MIIHFVRRRPDLEKKLESLIDFVVLHVGKTKRLHPIYLSVFVLALLCCNACSTSVLTCLVQILFTASSLWCLRKEIITFCCQI